MDELARNGPRQGRPPAENTRMAGCRMPRSFRLENGLSWRRSGGPDTEPKTERGRVAGQTRQRGADGAARLSARQPLHLRAGHTAPVSHGGRTQPPYTPRAYARGTPPQAVFPRPAACGVWGRAVASPSPRSAGRDARPAPGPRRSRGGGRAGRPPGRAPDVPGAGRGGQSGRDRRESARVAGAWAARASRNGLGQRFERREVGCGGQGVRC